MKYSTIMLPGVISVCLLSGWLGWHLQGLITSPPQYITVTPHSSYVLEGGLLIYDGKYYFTPYLDVNLSKYCGDVS